MARHGEGVLENTLLILKGLGNNPLMSGGEANGRGGYCPTPKDK